MRPDGRQPDELRPFTFERDFTEMAAGSVLASFGRTRLLCTASVDDDVPRWMRGSEKGWVTAEYSMLPGSTPGRANREAAKGKQSGRTQEIQRLIGRALRSVVDMRKLGERQIWCPKTRLVDEMAFLRPSGAPASNDVITCTTTQKKIVGQDRFRHQPCAVLCSWNGLQWQHNA